jgi:hypothetical protein
MTDSLEQLKTIRLQTLARIAEITAEPKPSYSIDGQSVSWNDYLKTLRDTVAWCDRMMNAENPGCEISRGYCA